jgi:hypothetical protein
MALETIKRNFDQKKSKNNFDHPFVWNLPTVAMQLC